MLRNATGIVLWLLCASLILLALSIALPFRPSLAMSYLTSASFIILLVLGAALLYLTLKSRLKGNFRLFLLLTGASAVGVTVFAVLHNLIYGLLVHFRGEGIGDEPFFFILATVVCPLCLLTGLIGSLIQYHRAAR